MIVFGAISASLPAQYRLIRLLRQLEPKTYAALGYPSFGIRSIELQKYIYRRRYLSSQNQSIRTAAHKLWLLSAVVAGAVMVCAVAVVAEEIWRS